MNALTISAMITRGRFTSKSGGALLDAFAVTAYATSAWLTLTTLGGVWMFWAGRDDIELDLAQLLGIKPAALSGVAWIYNILSFVALALLIVPLLSVGAGAARLGAKRRSTRLAAMRLVGVSGRRIIFLSILEALVLAGIGLVLGVVLYAVTLPAWSAVSLLGRRIDPLRMVLPWWGILGALVLIALITIAATASGLARVSISPLGVAKREIPRSVRVWRVVMFIGVFAAFIYLTSGLSPLQADVTTWVTLLVMLVLLFAAMSLAGSWLLQGLMRPVVKTSSPARLIAARRIISDARGSWRAVSAIVLMTLVAAVAIYMVPFTITASDDNSQLMDLGDLLVHDISTGVYIAFAFALILGAVSTLIQQSSDVFDRAEESRALVAIGTPAVVLTRARIFQVLVPALVLSLLAAGVGLLPALTIHRLILPNLLLLAAMMAIGMLLTLAAALATIPIQRAVLSQTMRKND